MDCKQRGSSKQLSEDQRIERRGLFPACVLIQGKLFSFTSYKGIPIMEDVHTGKMDLLEDLEDYDIYFKSDLMLREGNNIFVLELNGKRLMKYNIENKKCCYIDIDCDNRQWDNYAAFSKYGKYLYIFPRYSDVIIKVDSEACTIKKEKVLCSKMECSKKQGEDFSYFWCGCQIENTVWLFPKQGKFAIVYDMEQDIWKEYKISVSVASCVHVMHYNNKIYMLSAEGKIYRWNVMEESIEEMIDCSAADTNNTTFVRIAVTEQRIILLPALGDFIFCIDLESKKIEKYESYPNDFCYCGPEQWSKYYEYCEDDENYYFAMRSMNYLLIINKKSGKEKWIKTQLPSYEEFTNVYIKYSDMIIEDDCRLKDILAYLQKEPLDNQNRNYASSGEYIWQKLRV